LQHENLLHEKVVIRATNILSLQRNIAALQIERKCCTYYLALSGYFELEKASSLPVKYPIYLGLNKKTKLSFFCVHQGTVKGLT